MQKPYLAPETLAQAIVCAVSKTASLDCKVGDLPAIVLDGHGEGTRHRGLGGKCQLQAIDKHKRKFTGMSGANIWTAGDVPC